MSSVPALDIDASMAKYRDGKPLSANAIAERAEVWKVLERLEAAGWTPEYIDSDEPEGEKTPDKKAVMELVFNLDEARVHFTKGDRTHWVFFVRGNAPDEVLCDYSFARDGLDNFGETLDKMVDEIVAGWQAKNYAQVCEAYLSLLESVKSIPLGQVSPKVADIIIAALAKAEAA